jgi:hypothetical protein
MRNRHLMPSAAAVAMAVAAVLSATPASAAVTGPARPFEPSGTKASGVVNGPVRPRKPVVAKSRLVLTVARGERSAPAARQATLTCGPVGGSHRSARKACLAIGAAHGRLDKLVPDQTMCTMQYDPVTVTATGQWRGATVHYTHTFSNACVLGADTGPVFAF